MRIRFEFKPQDLWIGVYWRLRTLKDYLENWETGIDIWICLLPMLPLHISLTKPAQPDDASEAPCCGKPICPECGCCKCTGCTCWDEPEDDDLDAGCGEIDTDPYGDIPCMRCNREPCICYAEDDE